MWGFARSPTHSARPTRFTLTCVGSCNPAPLRHSVIVTTNLGFGNRTAVSGNPNMTTALLDRLTHRARIIECASESYRLKETLKEGRERSHTQLKTAVVEE